MISRFVQRTVSLALSALLTVALLGGIDQMTVLDPPATDMASKTAAQPRA